MSLKRIEQALRARIGLDPGSIGQSALQAAARVRMSELGDADLARYDAQLDARPGELERLIEEIVVRETWFFREQPAFEWMCQHCSKSSARREGPYRVLSVPCATGEEPYSIAIRLLQAGLPPAAFEVHAVDVSTRALQAAAAATYRKNSFRGEPQDHDAYFERTPDGMRVVDRVRERVQFSHGNVLDPGLHAGRQFDAIFCRNLLIYLEPDARRSALRNLSRLLRRDGVLFAGHSEALELMAFGLRRVGEARSFAFELPEAETTKTAQPPASAPRMPATWPGATRAAPALRPQPAVGQPAEQAARLEDARSLADRGQLAAARERCEQSLAAAPSADGYCLLGIIMTAAGDHAGARGAFDKALYLDAAHYDALIHLALLHEKGGDRAAANKLRGRAERAALRAQRTEGA